MFMGQMRSRNLGSRSKPCPCWLVPKWGLAGSGYPKCPKGGKGRERRKREEGERERVKERDGSEVKGDWYPPR